MEKMLQTQTTQNKLSEDWGIKKLGEIAEFIKGKKPLRFVDKKVKGAKPYILISSFENNTNEHYTDDNTCKECFKDDVLIVWDGARAGLSSVGHEGYIGSTITALRQKEKIILPKLLFYFISNHYEIFNKKIQGTGIPHLQKEYVYNLEIPIPPLYIQHLIVQKLDAFFEHYNKLKQEKQKAKEKYEKILQSAIAGLIPQKGLPKEWKKDKLVDLSIDIHPGSTPKQSERPFTQSGILFLRSENITNRGIKPTKNQKYIKRETYNKYPKNQVKQEDILYNIIGASIGRTDIVKNEKGLVNQNICKINVKKEIIYSPYLLYFLRKYYNINRISLTQKGGAQPALSATLVKNFDIIYPKIEMQKFIVKKLDKISEQIKIAEQEQKSIDVQLSQLPKAVLSKAFRGELV